MIRLRLILLLAIISFANSGDSFGGDLSWSGPSTGNIGAPVPTNSTVADCSIGNEAPSPQFVADFVQSSIEFAYLIDPADFNCCADGFQPENITFNLNVAPEDLFGSPVQVAVLEAAGSSGAWNPGSEICATPVGWRINADIPGYYTVKIPPYPTGIGDLVCPCLDSSTPFFIVGRIAGTIEAGAYPDAVRDGTPTGNRSFVRQGGGAWQDVVNDLGWAGELVLSAEVACCSGPVSIETSTWGQLKSLYR